MLHLVMDSSVNPDGTPVVPVDPDLIRGLGKHARRILLLAPRPEEEAVVLPPAGSTPNSAARHLSWLLRSSGDACRSRAWLERLVPRHVLDGFRWDPQR